jgi:hypothetical protein
MRIDPRLVRASRLLDPVAGREEGAWVFEYRGQAFLTDPGGGNPEPFVSTGQPRQPIESRAHSRPPSTGFDVRTSEDIARELRINPALLSFIGQSDPAFPRPILRFREGPIWDAEAVERWVPTRRPETPHR